MNLHISLKRQIDVYRIFSGSQLAIAEKIQQRRAQMLVHSCIYYELNKSIVSDMVWDRWAKELVQLQKDYPDISCQVMWYDIFKDWDGTTGAFLPLKEEWILQKALMLDKTLYKVYTVKEGCGQPSKKLGKLF